MLPPPPGGGMPPPPPIPGSQSMMPPPPGGMPPPPPGMEMPMMEGSIAVSEIPVDPMAKYQNNPDYKPSLLQMM